MPGCSDSDATSIRNLLSQLLSRMSSGIGLKRDYSAPVNDCKSNSRGLSWSQSFLYPPVFLSHIVLCPIFVNTGFRLHFLLPAWTVFFYIPLRTQSGRLAGRRAVFLICEIRGSWQGRRRSWRGRWSSWQGRRVMFFRPLINLVHLVCSPYFVDRFRVLSRLSITTTGPPLVIVCHCLLDDKNLRRRPDRAC